jgi:hypothetical protein
VYTKLHVDFKSPAILKFFLFTGIPLFSRPDISRNAGINLAWIIECLPTSAAGHYDLFIFLYFFFALVAFKHKKRVKDLKSSPPLVMVGI